jgi:hypothetical protein
MVFSPAVRHSAMRRVQRTPESRDCSREIPRCAIAHPRFALPRPGITIPNF